jgi:hypothetical protein
MPWWNSRLLPYRDKFDATLRRLIRDLGVLDSFNPLRSRCMLNTPHPLSRHRKTFFGWTRAVQQINDGRPAVVLSSGTKRQQMSVVQAVGFDVLVAGTCQWRPGDRIAVGFQSASSGVETTIPGTVHWLEQKHKEIELGIVLEDQVPDRHVLRLPGCIRANIRYSCSITGQLDWLQPHFTSCPATVTNYSREGICLQSKESPDIGTELKFSWLNDGRKMTVTGASRWTIDQNGTLLTGCELTNHMGYAICGVVLNSTRQSF